MRFIIFYVIFFTQIILAMEMAEERELIIDMTNFRPQELFDYECPALDEIKEQIYWQRLIFLSQLHNQINVSPFTTEQQIEFDAAYKKYNKDFLFIIGSIVVSVAVQSLGYLSFLGLLGNGTLGVILTSAILPSVGLASIGFGLFGTSYEPHSKVFEGIKLNLGEKVDKELERLALFLIRKSFSQDQKDRDNVAQIINNMDIEKLRTIYAQYTNASVDDLKMLFVELEEAIAYLQCHKILGNSRVVQREIRLCILEAKLCAWRSGALATQAYL